MLELAFMQRALVGSVAIGVLCGLLGFFVVLRRYAFIGVGISHSAIGGVALGVRRRPAPVAAVGGRRARHRGGLRSGASPRTR
jgi:ABC-type Mn2+/Zn2+ transport system permease subunit